MCFSSLALITAKLTCRQVRVTDTHSSLTSKGCSHFTNNQNLKNVPCPKCKRINYLSLRSLMQVLQYLLLNWACFYWGKRTDVWQETSFSRKPSIMKRMCNKRKLIWLSLYILYFGGCFCRLKAGQKMFTAFKLLLKIKLLSLCRNFTKPEPIIW